MLVFYFLVLGHHRDLLVLTHSFPTRRSSDLEAIAPQVLAVLKEWGWSEGDSRLGILNVNGSGISLGHPIGVTGVRIAATMLNEMRRRDVRYGLETMRSEEHTSELQSLMRISYAVFCLKKKKPCHHPHYTRTQNVLMTAH